ncbi:hypothetical protein EJB05_39679, partial [Eragrostis curvula]
MATSSRCRTLGITATHNFEVTNFSLLDGTGIGKYVSSSTFSVGGCNWKLNFYPNSEEKESEAFASVWLCLVEGPAGTRVKFHINLFDKDFEVSRKTGKRRRKEREETMLETDTKKFPRAGVMWGFPNDKYVAAVTSSSAPWAAAEVSAADMVASCFDGTLDWRVRPKGLLGFAVPATTTLSSVVFPLEGIVRGITPSCVVRRVKIRSRLPAAYMDLARASGESSVLLLPQLLKMVMIMWPKER